MKKLAIKVGEYQDREGKTKGKYVDLGVIMDGEHGEYALLNPSVDLAGCLVLQRILQGGKGKGDMVMCGVFEKDRKERQESGGSSAGGGGSSNDFDQDIPFAPVKWNSV